MGAMSEICAEMELLRVVAANDHGERVFEAERLGNFEIEALGVVLFDAMVDGGGIAVAGDSLRTAVRAVPVYST